MDALTAIAIGKFVIQAIEEGVPIAQKAADLLRAQNEPAALALLPEIEAAYAKARTRAERAHERVQSGG